MSLNTWQEATALGFPECGALGSGMSLMGRLETLVAYKKY